MSGLPEGWAKATIADLVSPDGLFSDGNWVESKDQDPNGSTRLIQLADIGDGIFLNKSQRFINEEQFSRLKCTEIKPDDILVARMPDPLGRACLMPHLTQRAITVVDVAIIRPAPDTIYPGWLMYFINTPAIRDSIAALSSGTTRRRISRSKLAEIAIPVPAKKEQERITRSLYSLTKRVRACRERLDRAMLILKRFRQSVLTAACSGRLTADWREQNPVVEAARDLLIRIEQARQMEAGTLREKNQIEEAFNSANLIVADEELAFSEIPASWIVCRIGAIGTVVNGSTPSRKRPGYWGGGIPWVSSGEVRNNIISTTRETISKVGYDASSVRLLPQGTVLLAMIGEGKTRGQTSVLRIDATINQNIAAVLLTHALVSSEYLWFWFQFQYEANREYGSGSGPQALNCQGVRKLPFVLPPLDEQAEIVRRVESLFAFADRLEYRLSAARTKAERLTPAVLAKAFRGELVPQDPNDEPASVLLERIRAARHHNLASRGKGV